MLRKKPPEITKLISVWHPIFPPDNNHIVMLALQGSHCHKGRWVSGWKVLLYQTPKTPPYNNTIIPSSDNLSCCILQFFCSNLGITERSLKCWVQPSLLVPNRKQTIIWTMNNSYANTFAYMYPHVKSKLCWGTGMLLCSIIDIMVGGVFGSYVLATQKLPCCGKLLFNADKY